MWPETGTNLLGWALMHARERIKNPDYSINQSKLMQQKEKPNKKQKK